MIVEKMASYFKLREGTRGVRFNWYRDTQDWKPFHHDSAAFNPQRVSRYRQVGYMKHRLTKQQFYDNSVDAGEIPKAEDAQAVYIVETKSDGQGPIGWLRVRYKDPQTEQVHMKLKVIGFSGSAPSMDNANFPIKLAFSSGVFAERISGNPYGTSVDLAYIQKVIESVISNYPNDKRPVQLLEMIRVARSLKL